MTTKQANRVRWITALILFLCTAGIYELAKHAPGLLFPWYQNGSRKLLNLWGHITDLFPFSLLEWGGLGLIWLALGWIIKVISRRRGLGKLCSTAALIASIILFLFVALWGADQFAPTFTSTTA